MGKTLAKSTLQWGKMFGTNPIAHGSPAEALWIDAIDQTQLTALWATIPHWSTNCIIPRASTVYVPVCIPPFVDRVVPVVIASGNGSVRINDGMGAGASTSVELTGDAADLAIEFSDVYKAGKISFAATATNVHWARVTCDTDVRVYALSFFWDRSTTELVNAF